MYKLPPCRVGVFASKLELQWFVFFRQRLADMQYVGHVDAWRDFVVCSRSVEIRPASANEWLQACWQRAAPHTDKLVVLIGNPIEHEAWEVSGTLSERVDRRISLDGIS
jgi:hypothetical protein